MKCRTNPFCGHTFDIKLEHRRQACEHRIAFRLGAAEKAAYDPSAFAIATMTDGVQSAILRRANDILAGYRRNAEVTSHKMQIIARQQNDLSGPNRHALSVLAFDSKAEGSFHDVMIDDQVGCGAKRRRTMLRRDARGDAPRREEFSVQENAASQTRDPQNV